VGTSFALAATGVTLTVGSGTFANSAVLVTLPADTELNAGTSTVTLGDDLALTTADLTMDAGGKLVIPATKKISTTTGSVVAGNSAKVTIAKATVSAGAATTVTFDGTAAAGVVTVNAGGSIALLKTGAVTLASAGAVKLGTKNALATAGNITFSNNTNDDADTVTLAVDGTDAAKVSITGGDARAFVLTFTSSILTVDALGTLTLDKMVASLASGGITITATGAVALTTNGGIFLSDGTSGTQAATVVKGKLAGNASGGANAINTAGDTAVNLAAAAVNGGGSGTIKGKGTGSEIAPSANGVAISTSVTFKSIANATAITDATTVAYVMAD
jgi:hypothetical protein